jgi:serine/threonine protein kinase
MFLLITYRVDGDSNAKISDFGMARRLHQSDYMKMFRPKVATRWMAPEIFTENKFALQSDVVS